MESALAAIRETESSRAAQYRRIMRHRGHKKAIVPVAHSTPFISYYTLFRQKPYSELYAAYLEKREKDHAIRHNV